MPTPSDRALQELTDQARAAEAAAARRRRRALLDQAGEEGTFAGVLTDLAERRSLVAVHTRAGRLLRGRIAVLGADHLGLVGTSDDRTWAPVAAVTGLRPEPGTPATVGDRTERPATSWPALLVELAVDRPSIVLTTVGGDRIPGRLWSAGQDLVVVRTDRGAESYVPMAAVNDLTLT